MIEGQAHCIGNLRVELQQHSGCASADARHRLFQATPGCRFAHFSLSLAHSPVIVSTLRLVLYETLVSPTRKFMLCDDLARLETASNPALSIGSSSLHAMPDPTEFAFVIRVVTRSKRDRRAAHSTALLRSACEGQAMLESADATQCCQFDGPGIMVCMTERRLRSSTANTRNSQVECIDFRERWLSPVYSWEMSGLCTWCCSHQGQS